MRLKVENQAEYRKARAIIVTCVDNQDVEGQLSIGSQYEVQGITHYGSDSYYKLRNDCGDLADYGHHRFNTQVEA